MSPVISHPRPAAARHQFDELSPITITVDCPAKTNLTLEVGPAHDEWGGRHELDTIYCAIGVYDTVTATAKQPGAGFSLELEGAYLGDLASSRSDMRRNHAVLALFAMAQAAEREPDVALTITKRIPVGAGLGGGSADAAATMLAVNRLWDLNWPIERLRTIAATLGADMPFCLTGGLAYGTGFGERITDITPGSRDELALIEQGFSGEVLVGAYQSQLSTPEVYHTFDIVGAAEGDRNHLQAAAISLHPRSGQVLVDGEDIVNYEPADLADKIGYVFQNPDLQILEDTVFDEVAYGPRAKKLTAETIKKQVEAALAATGLAELAGAYPRLLSFGQKRRLGVASALALNPRTLILDEITNGQDAIEKERMMQYLQTLNEEKGITIVLISHDMDVVRRYAKRAIVLKDGDLVYDGTPTELFGGAYAVEEWGLRRPTAAALAGSLGFTAATPEEFCRLLVRKGAED